MSFGIFLIIAIVVIFAITLIIMVIQKINAKNRCTVEIIGNVVNLIPENVSVSDTNLSSYSGYGTVGYRPIIQYSYNGKTFQCKYKVAKTSYASTIQIGTPVNIKINPDNPTETIIITKLKGL